jgi:hypothetical protein
MITLNRKSKIIISVFVVSILSVIYLVFSTKKIPTQPGPIPSPTPPFQTINENKYESIVYKDPQSNYEVSYLPQENRYIITIYGSPFAKYRLEAEQLFLKTYKITPQEACLKNISTGTPFYANPSEAGKIYKLSFCP